MADKMATVEQATNALGVTSSMPSNKLITYDEMLSLIPESSDGGLLFKDDYQRVMNFSNTDVLIYTQNKLNKTCPPNKITDVNITGLSSIGSNYWFIQYNAIFQCVYMIIKDPSNYYYNQMTFINRPTGGNEQKVMCVQEKTTLIISPDINPN